jgi:hypothetical protein
MFRTKVKTAGSGESVTAPLTVICQDNLQNRLESPPVLRPEQSPGTLKRPPLRGVPMNPSVFQRIRPPRPHKPPAPRHLLQQ